MWVQAETPQRQLYTGGIRNMVTRVNIMYVSYIIPTQKRDLWVQWRRIYTKK